MLNFLKDLIGQNIKSNTSNETVSSSVDLPQELLQPQPFRLIVADVFTIKGLGVVASGKVESGVVLVGQAVKITNADNQTIPSQILSIEVFRKKLKKAEAGLSVGLVLDNLSKDQVTKGSVIESTLNE